MSDNQDAQELLIARKQFEQDQLEFNKKANALRILELRDQIRKEEENIKATDIALSKLREGK